MKLLVVSIDKSTENLKNNSNVNHIILKNKNEFESIFNNKDWEWVVFTDSNLSYTTDFYSNVEKISRVGLPQIIYTLRSFPHGGKIVPDLCKSLGLSSFTYKHMASFYLHRNQCVFRRDIVKKIGKSILNTTDVYPLTDTYPSCVGTFTHSVIQKCSTDEMKEITTNQGKWFKLWKSPGIVPWDRTTKLQVGLYYTSNEKTETYLSLEKFRAKINLARTSGFYNLFDYVYNRTHLVNGWEHQDCEFSIIYVENEEQLLEITSSCRSPKILAFCEKIDNEDVLEKIKVDKLYICNQDEFSYYCRCWDRNDFYAKIPNISTNKINIASVLCDEKAQAPSQQGINNLTSGTPHTHKVMRYGNKNISCVQMFTQYNLLIVRATTLSFEMVQVITDAVSAGCMVLVPEWFTVKLGLIKYSEESYMNYEQVCKFYSGISWENIANYIVDNFGLLSLNRLCIDWLKSHQVIINDLESYEHGLVIDHMYKSGAVENISKQVKWSMEISSTPKIYIATPCYGNMIMCPFVSSLLKTIEVLKENNISYEIDFMGNESLVQRARNVLTQRFLNSKCTHLLFIDADIEWNPQAAVDLINFDKDVSCCVYPKKAYYWEQLLESYKQPTKEAVHSRGLDFNINITNPKYEKIGDFIKVKDSATGFMMIKKDILIKIIKKYPELTVINDGCDKTVKTYCAMFDCIIDPESGVYLSEDYSFCRRVQKVGGEVWINIRHNLTHYGTHGFKSDISNRTNITRCVK